jgi:hypothetical protein
VSRPSRSTKAGNRGRHRHIDSPQTKVFHELEADPGSVLNVKPTDPRVAKVKKPKRSKAKRPERIGPPPARPSWLGSAEYVALLELRSELETGRA